MSKLKEHYDKLNIPENNIGPYVSFLFSVWCFFLVRHIAFFPVWHIAFYYEGKSIYIRQYNIMLPYM